MRINHIILFARCSNIRLINTCKDEEGNKCIGEHGKTVFAIQIQNSFLGITYWKTIFKSTSYCSAVYNYKCLIVGHPDFLVN